MSLSAEIKQRALAAGFDVAGIAPIDAAFDLDFARDWVESGRGGEMTYLRNPKRGDPRLVLPSAKSVVCVGLVYNAPLPYSTETGCRSWEASRQLRAGRPQRDATRSANPVSRIRGKKLRSRDQGRPSEARAWISRYAWGRDYHKVMRARLERLRGAIEQLAPGVETRVYVDTGPIVERAFARLSGIGWVGKNTCLINQDRGSWIFLGVILTSLALDRDTPAFDRCGSCRRCLDACPTGALTGPYVMDASRCIAYFNIELKGSIPEEFRPAIGANAVGCDICQDVCPWNRGDAPGRRGSAARERRPPAATAVPEFLPLTVSLNRAAATPGAEHRHPDVSIPDSEARSFSLFNPRLEDLAALTEDDFRRAFRDSPIKRVKYRGWLRNLCVVMGNSGDARCRPWLERMRAHEDAVVREHAQWALARLDTREARS